MFRTSHTIHLFSAVCHFTNGARTRYKGVAFVNKKILVFLNLLL